MAKGSKHLRVAQSDILRLAAQSQSMCELVAGAVTDAEKIATLETVYKWAHDIATLVERDKLLAEYFNRWKGPPP